MILSVQYVIRYCTSKNIQLKFVDQLNIVWPLDHIYDLAIISITWYIGWKMSPISIHVYGLNMYMD